MARKQNSIMAPLLTSSFACSIVDGFRKRFGKRMGNDHIDFFLQGLFCHSHGFGNGNMTGCQHQIIMLNDFQDRGYFRNQAAVHIQ